MPRHRGRAPAAHSDLALELCVRTGHGQRTAASCMHVIGMDRPVFGPRWEGTTDD